MIELKNAKGLYYLYNYFHNRGEHHIWRLLIKRILIFNRHNWKSLNDIIRGTMIYDFIPQHILANTTVFGCWHDKISEYENDIIWFEVYENLNKAIADDAEG